MALSQANNNQRTSHIKTLNELKLVCSSPKAFAFSPCPSRTSGLNRGHCRARNRHAMALLHQCVEPDLVTYNVPRFSQHDPLRKVTVASGLPIYSLTEIIKLA